MNQTNRDSSKEIEQILLKEFKVLDHGFVRVIDYMGSDKSIVQAARVSYGEGTKTINQDESLIRYLMKHKHTSPFEMCEIKFHIKLPIFIARQWIRHRTANVNEVSARYSILPNEFYIPSQDNISIQAENNKQGRSQNLKPELAQQVKEKLIQSAQNGYLVYEQLLSEEYNLARELARMSLTLNHYTEWYWKVDLHNLFHFLNLRLHSHAQYEIRVYAQTILDIIKKWCPISASAFEEYTLNAHTFSSSQIKYIKLLLSGEKSPQINNLSKREIDEIESILLK